MASGPPGETSGPPLPRPEELIEAFENAASQGGDVAPVALEDPGDAAAAEGETDVERQRGYAHLVGLQRHYRHKSQWSYFLMAMMFGMLAFQSFLLWRVGINAWTFAKYDWLLPGLLIQNLAQIAGLCVIVVKALFKDMA